MSKKSEEERLGGKRERWDRAMQRVLDTVINDPDVNDSFEAVTVLTAALVLVCQTAPTPTHRETVREMLANALKLVSMPQPTDA